MISFALLSFVSILLDNLDPKRNPIDDDRRCLEKVNEIDWMFSSFHVKISSSRCGIVHLFWMVIGIPPMMNGSKLDLRANEKRIILEKSRTRLNLLKYIRSLCVVFFGDGC